MKRIWGSTPPLKTWCLNRHLHHGQLCLQHPGFGPLAQVMRCLEERQLPARGPGGKHPPYRWNWPPQPRQTKSWCGSPRQKNCGRGSLLGERCSTLEVVMEAAGPLLHSQIEGLGALFVQAVVPA